MWISKCRKFFDCKYALFNVNLNVSINYYSCFVCYLELRIYCFDDDDDDDDDDDELFL